MKVTLYGVGDAYLLGAEITSFNHFKQQAQHALKEDGGFLEVKLADGSRSRLVNVQHVTQVVEVD